MKVKTSELTGRALDWMTGVALGYEMSSYGTESLRARVPGLGVHAPWRPSYYWSQGGPIIEREGLAGSVGTKQIGTHIAMVVSKISQVLPSYCGYALLRGVSVGRGS